MARPHSSVPVRVVAADPRPLFRDALGRAVRHDPDLDLVAEAEDAAELRAALRRLRPDVAVGDVELLEPLLHDTKANPTRLVILTADVTPPKAFAVIELGAAGYLSKDADGAAIRRAIAAVARGETVLAPAAQTAVAKEARLRARDERPPLSPREQEILVLIAGGRTAPAIARELQLSTATIKTHLVHLYGKLRVADRAAAVAAGMRWGLLE